MKIECTRDSRWGNTKGGGPQTFKQGQVLVVGEDVNEFRAEDMLRCDYAEKVGEPIVKETKASTETDLTASDTTLGDQDTEDVETTEGVGDEAPLETEEATEDASEEIATSSEAPQEEVKEAEEETKEEEKEEKPSDKTKKKGAPK